MTKRTSQRKPRVQAVPVKSETSFNEVSTKIEAEVLKEVLEINDPNERSEELAKYDLTEGQKDAAQDAAKRDFLSDQDYVSGYEETEVTPLSRRAQKLIEELTAKGIYTPYPSDFSKWDDATFARIEKLNR